VFSTLFFHLILYYKMCFFFCKRKGIPVHLLLKELFQCSSDLRKFVKSFPLLFLFLYYPYFGIFPFHVLFLVSTIVLLICVLLYFCSFLSSNKKATWRHLYCRFKYIYSVLIEKDLYECRDVSVKFSYAFWFLLFIPVFVLSVLWYFPFALNLL
jgi:hypothetical protein